MQSGNVRASAAARNPGSKVIPLANNASPRLHFHLPDGSVKTVVVDGSEYTVMAAARRAGIPGIQAHCGGNRACATCHVHIAEPWLEIVGPAGRDERALLELSDDCRRESRLCCQIRVVPAIDGLELTPVP